MLCADLEPLEGQFDDILTALENPALAEMDRQSLEQARSPLSRVIRDHQKFGHNGGECFGE
jgi:hypothetical protein